LFLLRYVFRPEDALGKSHKHLWTNAFKAQGVDFEYIGCDDIHPDKIDKQEKDEGDKRGFAALFFTPVTGSLDDLDICIHGVDRFYRQTFSIVDFVKRAIDPPILFLDKEPLMLTAIQKWHTSSISYKIPYDSSSYSQ
jgi:hypothetical protein